jgi:hypothetical protein
MVSHATGPIHAGTLTTAIGAETGWANLIGTKYRLRGKRGGLGCCVHVELCKFLYFAFAVIEMGMGLMRSRYREAIELLYTEPHFHFPVAERDDVERFFNALSPHRRDAIEALSIDTRYTEHSHLPAVSWKILGGFRGLKFLRVDVRHLWFNSTVGVERKMLLRRLTKVREQVASLKVLELVFDGDEDEVWEEWKSVSARQGVTLVLKELTHMGKLEVSGHTFDFIGGYHFR